MNVWYWQYAVLRRPWTSKRFRFSLTLDAKYIHLLLPRQCELVTFTVARRLTFHKTSLTFSLTHPMSCVGCWGMNVTYLGLILGQYRLHLGMISATSPYDIGPISGANIGISGADIGISARYQPDIRPISANDIGPISRRFLLPISSRYRLPVFADIGL